MSEIASLTDWIKSQPELFTKKKKFLFFTDYYYAPTGEKVKEGFRYFNADSADLVTAFDADDIDAISRLPYALDNEGEVDTSHLRIDLAYTASGALCVAQPVEYIDYAPTRLRELKHLAPNEPVSVLMNRLDQAS